MLLVGNHYKMVKPAFYNKYNVNILMTVIKLNPHATSWQPLYNV